MGVEDRSGIFFPVLELFALQVLPPPSVLERVPSSRARLISQAEESSSFLTQQNLYTGLDPSPAEPDFFLSSWGIFLHFASFCFQSSSFDEGLHVFVSFLLYVDEVG